MKIMNVIWVATILLLILSGCSEGPQINHTKSKVVDATVIKKEHGDVSEWEVTLQYKHIVIVYGYDHSDYYDHVKVGDKVPVTYTKGYTIENKLEMESIDPVNL
jgi:ABC-type Fe3+-citrate transport system substrate-binding protein